MVEAIRELIKYRELLYMIAWRDIHIKYKQSVMGVMWAIFMPMLIVLTGVLVKYGASLLSGKPMDVSDIAGVSVKSVPWAFFVASVRFSTNSLVGNSNLVTKIYFPRAVFPVAAVCSQFFDFAIASCLLMVILFIVRVGLSANMLWVPLLLFLLVLLATGIGVLLSAANLFYRDVKYLVEVVLTFAIFITPVFYDVSMFGKWGRLLMLNPVAPILEGLNACVVRHASPNLEWLSYSAVFSLSLIVFAFAFFRKLEWLFAERI
jgi:ABC-type polysaccharide/polyol phosphate export permease